MNAVLDLFADQPVLLLAALLTLGAALGHVAVAGVRIGPAAVLFSAIAVSALGTAADVELEIPEVLGTFGLVLFTYTVGVVSGPQFFASLGRGWRTMLSVVLGFVAVTLVAVGLGGLLGLSMPVIAGAMAGALTNTPALAAASEAAGDPTGPTIGYSISYLGGVVVMLLAAAWALRRPDEGAGRAGLTHLTVRVESEDAPTVEELQSRYDHLVAVSRIKHGHDAAPTVVPDDEDRVGRGDLVTVVGPKDLVARVATDLGHVSSHDIVADRREADYRRVTVSNKALAGRTLREADLEGRFGAAVSRVRRGDVDLVAHDDFVLQMGDRVRVIAPAARMREVSTHLGDSDRGMSDINVGGLALGLLLGLALGLVVVPFPGGGFAIGAAAGTLLTGLVFGRIGRLGPVVTSMSHGAAQSLSALGMVTFLAYAGVRAGQRFTEAVTSEAGWRIAVLGLVVTGLTAAILLLAGTRLHRLAGVEVAGTIAGAQTQPAILAFADDRTGFDPRVGVAYALVYPASMIAKIVLAQVVAGLG
ncbi:MAG TPA: TrkA C-terminal domain-containing protein [Dermatophilaceae bacterium]|nr:TrkA C-terminal domain-containing protein [Dermatophilaceae bacterium]